MGLLPYLLVFALGIAAGAYIFSIEKRTAINKIIKDWWDKQRKGKKSKKRRKGSK